MPRSLNVYFIAPRMGSNIHLTNGFIQNIIAHIAKDHKVLTGFNPFLSAPSMLMDGKTTIGEALSKAEFDQSRDWGTFADCAIIECSNPSIEVGIRAMHASANRIPILLLHAEGTHLPPLIMGLPGKVESCMWEDATDIGIRVTRFLTETQNAIGG